MRTARVAGMGLGCLALASPPAWADARAAARAESPVPVAVTSPDERGVWTDRLIVRLRSAEAASILIQRRGRAGELLARWNVNAVRPATGDLPLDPARAAKCGLDRYFVLEVPEGTDTPAMARAFAALDELVELAEPDPVGVLHLSPSDPGLSQQWALDNTGQRVGALPGLEDADVDWLESWLLVRPTGAVVVAVLDTGVSVSHPDLEGRTVPGRCFVCGTGDPNNTDDGVTLSHGTLCSGIIAAGTDNGIGICGVSTAARVMPIKVTTGLLASQTYTGNGLIWAADHGARIASMSWGFGATANVSFLRSAVEYASGAGMLLVASTGNSPGAAIGYPARWPEVIAVGATTNVDGPFAGGTTGPEIDMVAPGQDILTTVDQLDQPNGYMLATGTSMAVPMVAAAAAELWAVEPRLSASDVRMLLESSVDDLGEAGWDPTFGQGRLNLLSALRRLPIDPPACGGDYDNDGAVGLSDLFAFLVDFFAMSGRTGPGLHPDVDQNGSVDVQDLFTFMQQWFAGC